MDTTRGEMMDEWVKRLTGRFVVIDGPDGAGKSTQIALLCDYLTAGGADVVRTFDPGATAVGGKIRAILLDHDSGPISPMCETMLFMASRAQLMEEIIKPALDRKQVVVCDRFVTATIAYQGAAGVNVDTILTVADVAIGGLWPDLTIILDVPVSLTRQRLGGRADRIEARGDDYHARVREGFLRQAATSPDRFAVVDAAAAVDRVQEQMRSILKTHAWGKR
ncbi:MAG: dTMP kinase [Planctomycetota bacterium]|nr:dTMP kinase [Planctomycetota bacterium]